MHTLWTKLNKLFKEKQIVIPNNPSPRRTLLLCFFAFSVFILFYIVLGINEKTISQKSLAQNQTVSKISIESPITLKIPSINVIARIQRVGITPKGDMDVPTNTVDVGWFGLGPRPGETGSAVIAGHLNGGAGKDGVFANLHKLKQGDKLYVEDSKGKSIIFIVREIRTLDTEKTGDIFSRSDGIYLNLITCDGVWDEIKNNYSKRLVIFADIKR